MSWDNGSGLGVAYGEDKVRIVENEINYDNGVDFWKDTVQTYGLSEATIICGNYLQTKLSTESNPEKQFCKELFSSFYENTAGKINPYQVVYPYDYARASDRLEVNFYHESSKRNTECAQAIDIAIHASCYKANYYNLDIAAMRVLQEYGFQRVNAVLACNIHNRLYDGRFSAGNKDWSAEMLMDQASFKQALIAKIGIFDTCNQALGKLKWNKQRTGGVPYAYAFKNNTVPHNPMPDGFLLFLRFVCAFSSALLSILSFIVFCIAVGTLILLRESMSALHISIMVFVISPVGLPLLAE